MCTYICVRFFYNKYTTWCIIWNSLPMNNFLILWEADIQVIRISLSAAVEKRRFKTCSTTCFGLYISTRIASQHHIHHTICDNARSTWYNIIGMCRTQPGSNGGKLSAGFPHIIGLGLPRIMPGSPVNFHKFTCHKSNWKCIFLDDRNSFSYLQRPSHRLFVSLWTRRVPPLLLLLLLLLQTKQRAYQYQSSSVQLSCWQSAVNSSLDCISPSKSCDDD